jgi:hypothetical protein
MYNMTDYGFWAIVIGLVFFLLPILIAMANKNWKLSELDNGEIRKAIMIAFTVIYIILLPYYFFNAYMPAAEILSKTNATELIIPKESGQNLTLNISASSVPAASVNDLLRNFLWVYIFLIIFYFGSRSLDGYTEAKRIENLKGAKPEEIIKTQYARGKINKATMDRQLTDLKDK